MVFGILFGHDPLSKEVADFVSFWIKELRPLIAVSVIRLYIIYGLKLNSPKIPIFLTSLR